MASKKKSAGGVNKSEFIRSHPDKSAKEIVELGKSQGITLTPAHIYVVRAKSKKGGASGAKRGPKAGGAKAKSGSSNAVRMLSSLSANEKEFLKLASKVGMDRAATLLSVAGEVMAALR